MDWTQRATPSHNRRLCQDWNFLSFVLLDLKELVELGPAKDFPDFGAQAA
jgi:hypothetical protein